MAQTDAGTRVAVIGAGAWGTTLANLLAEKGYAVTLWVYEPDLATSHAPRAYECAIFARGGTASQRHADG